MLIKNICAFPGCNKQVIAAEKFCFSHFSRGKSHTDIKKILEIEKRWQTYKLRDWENMKEE